MNEVLALEVISVCYESKFMQSFCRNSTSNDTLSDD